MNFFSELAQNKILISAASGWIIAQILKTIIHTLFTKNFDAERLVGGGGMPSSHSAGVMGLATTVGLIQGFASVDYAMALGYALVVMYDAAGVRRAAGKQAACLNKIIMDIYKQELKEAGGKLKELLGHTPIQVFWGAVLGAVYAYYMHKHFLGLL